MFTRILLKCIIVNRFLNFMENEKNINKLELPKILTALGVIIVIIVIIFTVKSKDEPKTTYRGYTCATPDCSGHKAGYEWAANKNIEYDSNCDGNSQSFIEGCKAYVKSFNNEIESEALSSGSCIMKSEITYYSTWMHSCNLQGLLTPKCEQLEDAGHFSVKYAHRVLHNEENASILEDIDACKCRLPADLFSTIRQDYNTDIGICERKCEIDSPGSFLCNMSDEKL